jgi:hypothetical protein
MELVEHDRADAAQLGVGGEAPREDPLGHVAEARARGRDVLEADLPADGLSRLLAALLGDAARGKPGGQAARLEDDDLTFDDVEQGGRDAGGLAGAGWRLQDDRASTEGLDQVRQERVDRERRELNASASCT